MPDLILGFDFGLKHIGVAVGQSYTGTAQPITSLSAQNGIPNWVEIKKLLDTWKPKLLVIGLPLNMDGSDQPITAYARKFAEELHQRFNLPIHLMDERLSTKEARAHLFEQGGYKALKKKSIDSLSAQLILESWLAEQKLK